MTTTNKIITAVGIAALTFWLLRKNRPNTTTPPASTDSGAPAGTSSNATGPVPISPTKPMQSIYNTLQVLKIKRQKLQTTLAYWLNARDARKVSATKASILANEQQINLWGGKLRVLTSNNAMSGNASAGLNGGTSEVGYGVIYGCKDGTTSKTAAGCGGAHKGADWVRTF